MLSMSLMFKQINENHPNAPYCLDHRRIEPDCVVAIFGRPCFSLRPSPTRPGRRHLKSARPGGRHWKLNLISHPLFRSHIASDDLGSNVISHLPIFSPKPYRGSQALVGSHIACPLIPGPAFSSQAVPPRNLCFYLHKRLWPLLARCGHALPVSCHLVERRAQSLTLFHFQHSTPREHELLLCSRKYCPHQTFNLHCR